jgi:predicted nucleotidyltransferase component of viral defense system
MSSADDATEGALTPFQIDVARIFFSLPQATGFLLAGGAALVAQRLTIRPTQDLDLFTSPGRGNVAAAGEAFETAARHHGWTVTRLRHGPEFARLSVQGPHEAVLVDLAVDATPILPATASPAGPTLSPDDLAGRKVIALFDRAEARDFTDVHSLAAHYPLDRLLELAAEVDRGFDLSIFADMLDSLRRFKDSQIPTSDAPRLRAFFSQWTQEIRSRLPLD